MTKRSPVEWCISAGTYIYAGLLLLLLPLNLVAACFIAAAVHECCHIALLRLFHVPVLSITLGIGGAVIRTGPLSPKQELLCAAAGPAGSLLCLALVRRFPLFALCGCIQGLFNLLPVLPLDGGRMLRCFCLCFCPKYTEAVCHAARILTMAVVLFICTFLSLHTQDAFFILIAIYFLLRTGRKRKTPCKRLPF